MPVDYVIDKDRKLVITTAMGIVTGSQALDHQQRLKDDPDFQPQFCQLLDLTAVHSFSMDVNEIRQLTAVNIFAQESRRAAVAGSDLSVGIMRMLKTYAELSGRYKELRIFPSREEALRWLFDRDSA